MYWWFTVFCFQCGAGVVHSAKVATQGVRYVIWEVQWLKDGQRTFIKNLDNKGAINIINERQNIIEVMVEGTRTSQIDKLLRERDINYEPKGTEQGPIRTRTKYRSPGSGVISNSNPKYVLGWTDYYPLYMINNWMYELERLYPSTCTVTAIGKSVEGRSINMLKVSNSDARNTGVWIDGGIHAREWISISVVTYIADYIVKNFSVLPMNITNKDWYFVPVTNPDGYLYSFATERMWRKSRARFGNTIVGVDLNRNFGHQWGLNGVEATTQGDPCHNNYRGQEPFSEPETTAIKDLILYAGAPFKIFLTYHAFSEVIAFPWCYTSEPCPDYVSLLEGGAIMAKAMFETTGRMYKVGNFRDVMYTAAGTSIDWSYGTARIPFSYLIELRSKEHRFLLPKDEIIDCCKEALSGVLALAKFVETRKCMNCVILTEN